VNTFSLVGKTALVAGASRGIGLEIARHMAAAGASVILAARSKDALEAHAAEIGGRALVLDVADPQSIATAVAAIETPDILVNVAGINLRKRAEEFTREELRPDTRDQPERNLQPHAEDRRPDDRPRNGRKDH
jgi:NADP-dependent 3-hydroxy acid dehydrogenase YdfG